MPPPKDPEKYAEYLKKRSELMKGRTPWNKGKHHSDESKAKMSAKLKGRVAPNKGKHLSEEHKEKLSLSHLGRRHSPEAIEKIKEASKKPRPGRKGRPAHNKGKPMSEEQKAKLSASRKGIPRSPEASAKAAESNRGKKRTPEACARIGARHKGKVVSAEARKNISKSAKGRKPPITGKEHTPQSKAKMSAAARARWERMSKEDKAKKSESLQEAAKDITNSWIENAYAQRLDAQGIIYERQKRIGWYRVDFYIPAENRIIEVNGCYWHACEQCNHIREDFEKKREADKKRYDYLRRKGYTVEIVWEHQLPRKPQKPP